MTRAEALRRQGGGPGESPEKDQDGPDPTEDPALYLEDEDRRETGSESRHEPQNA